MIKPIFKWTETLRLMSLTCNISKYTKQMTQTMLFLLLQVQVLQVHWYMYRVDITMEVTIVYWQYVLNSNNTSSCFKVSDRQNTFFIAYTFSSYSITQCFYLVCKNIISMKLFLTTQTNYIVHTFIYLINHELNLEKKNN